MKIWILIIWINVGSGNITKVAEFPDKNSCTLAGVTWQKAGEIDGTNRFWNRFVCLEQPK